VLWESRRLVAIRRSFARELQVRCGLRSERLVQALATTRREAFLPRGPWLLLESADGYTSTPSADPAHLYRDTAVAIEPARLLNNSQPSLLATLIDALEIREGARIVHVGCATGYYTAILAHVVGERGRVTALEIDPKICARARRSLRRWGNVEVVHADAVEYDPGPADGIVVDAGVTHPRAVWLDRLALGGHLALPLTGIRPPTRVARFVRNHIGRLLIVKRTPQGYSARFTDGVGIPALFGGRDPTRQRRLEEAYLRGGWEQVRSLRREPHAIQPSCWFHNDDFCLSTEP
jgi:protein-L-isoaspartate(D-aspartate) O-methyltransferase